MSEPTISACNVVPLRPGDELLELRARLATIEPVAAAADAWLEHRKRCSAIGAAVCTKCIAHRDALFAAVDASHGRSVVVTERPQRARQHPAAGRPRVTREGA